MISLCFVRIQGTNKMKEYEIKTRFDADQYNFEFFRFFFECFVADGRRLSLIFRIISGQQ